MTRSLLWVLWVAVFWVGATSPVRAEPKIAYQSFQLPNGLRVHVIEDHKAPLIYQVMLFHVGSKDEVANRTGFAHLFEHLMFKGSTHLPDGLLDRLFEAAGGSTSAFTDGDITLYHNVASANFLEMMMWSEADRLAGLIDTLDQPKLDNQRDVVLNERRQNYENRPYGMASILIKNRLWPKDHGYHWPTIGYAADLRAAALPDVARFFKTYYVPNNVTMVIAGDVAFDDVKRLATQYFAWIPKASEPARPRYRAPAPLTEPVVLHTTDEVKAPRVYLSWRGPAVFTAEEAPLALAAAVLGGGKSSRLYQRLVYDEKIAQDVVAWFDADSLAGVFQIRATAKPGVDPARLITEITEEVGKLAAAGPSPDELERAQSAFESDLLHRLESLYLRAVQLAYYDVIVHDPAYLANDLARYRAVTTKALRAAAATHLPPTARVVLTIEPGKKPEGLP